MDDYYSRDSSHIEARWCVDSESGIWYLIDLKTGQVLMIHSDWEDKNEH